MSKKIASIDCISREDINVLKKYLIEKAKVLEHFSDKDDAMLSNVAEAIISRDMACIECNTDERNAIEKSCKDFCYEVLARFVSEYYGKDIENLSLVIDDVYENVFKKFSMKRGKNQMTPMKKIRAEIPKSDVSIKDVLNNSELTVWSTVALMHGLGDNDFDTIKTMSGLLGRYEKAFYEYYDIIRRGKGAPRKDKTNAIELGNEKIGNVNDEQMAPGDRTCYNTAMTRLRKAVILIALVKTVLMTGGVSDEDIAKSMEANGLDDFIEKNARRMSDERNRAMRAFEQSIEGIPEEYVAKMKRTFEQTYDASHEEKRRRTNDIMAQNIKDNLDYYNKIGIDEVFDPADVDDFF